MGLLLSQVIRHRWLSLIGLAIALLSISVGALTGSGVLIAVLIGIGGALMVAQVVVSVTRNVKAMREGKPPQF
jgi:hypothetical protein